MRFKKKLLQISFKPLKSNIKAYYEYDKPLLKLSKNLGHVGPSLRN